MVDLPVDTAAQDGSLRAEGSASRPWSELGDFVDYTVGVRNGTGNVLDQADVIAHGRPAGGLRAT